MISGYWFNECIIFHPYQQVGSEIVHIQTEWTTLYMYPKAGSNLSGFFQNTVQSDYSHINMPHNITSAIISMIVC